MIVAKEKRENNIAEYLLYMWQVEDIIRACNYDITVINANIVSIIIFVTSFAIFFHPILIILFIDNKNNINFISFN